MKFLIQNHICNISKNFFLNNPKKKNAADRSNKLKKISKKLKSII